MTVQDAVDCAIEELVAPKLSGTRRLLELHAYAIDVTNLYVVYAETRHLPEYALVYFRMDGYSYHLMVTVTSGETAEAYAVSIEASVRVMLKIRGALIPDEITTCLGLSPTRIYEPTSAHRRRSGALHNTFEWVFEPQRERPGSVEEKLDFLLGSLTEATPRIGMLRAHCEIRISVVYHGWSGNAQFGGWSISPRLLHQINMLGADFDFDLYATGPANDESRRE